MTQISDEVAVAAVLVGLTSESEAKGRIAALRRFAAVCAEAGDQDAAGTALAEAVKALDQSKTGSAAGNIGSTALHLGQQAESIGRITLAREAYEVGVAELEADPANLTRGVLWQAIGSTWSAENEGAQALDSFRMAVDLKRHSDNARSRIISFSSLVGAEATWGSPERCEGLLREGLQLLEPAVESRAESLDDFAVTAHNLGRAAEATGWPTLARRAYELTLELVDAGFRPPTPGLVLHDIGDTWLADDEGPRALEAFRSAARRKKGAENAFSCVETLTDLAGAELEWGDRSACESAVEEAAELLAGATSAFSGDPEWIADVAQTLGELAELVNRPELAGAVRKHGDAEEPPVGDGQLEEGIA